MFRLVSKKPLQFPQTSFFLPQEFYIRFDQGPLKETFDYEPDTAKIKATFIHITVPCILDILMGGREPDTPKSIDAFEFSSC